MNMTAIQNISPDTPLVINNYGELLTAFKVVMTEAFAPKEDKPELISTRKVRQILATKGYRVKSYKSINQILANNNIQATSVGKDNWYSKTDIDNIPER